MGTVFPQCMCGAVQSCVISLDLLIVLTPDLSHEYQF